MRRSSTIVLTGARGFLGRHLARRFAAEGHTIVGIGHGEWSREEWQTWGLSEWYPGDVTFRTLERHAGVPAAIVHCAGGGSVAYSMENPLVDFNRTVATTAEVLEYVRLRAPSCRVVYPSSASVYGTVERVPIREDCRAAPISQYGAHKLMAELMVASYARQFGTAASIVRLFSVYGCGLRKQLLWDACCKFAVGDPIFMGTGDEVRDWLHVEDAAKLLLAATKHASPQCEIVNGGSGEGTTVRDVLIHLSRGLLLEKIIPTFSGTPRIGDPSRYIADIERSRAWGWKPDRPWKVGIREYAAWWSRSQGERG